MQNWVASACQVGQKTAQRDDADSRELAKFFPKDDNLGKLMSTVCGVHVGGWAGVGACSAEEGRRPAGPAGGRLWVDLFRFVSPRA